MKKYLVTGGAGFIGANFVHYVLEHHRECEILNADALTYAGNLENLSSIEGDPRYNFVQADIRDQQKMGELINTFDPDFVVNFAAESHVDRSIENPSIFADTNVMGTLSLLNAVKAAWVDTDRTDGRKYLQVSTDEVYGTLSLNKPDEYFRETTPLSPHSPYSASKASADMFVRAYADTFGLPINITRCSNNYGPYQFPEKLIPLMIHNAQAHKQLPVYGDGQNVRDWLYVEDHCKAIDLVLTRGKVGEVYNVGGHNEHANIYIVKRIISELQSSLSDPAINEALIVHVEDRLGHDRRYGIAPDKIKVELGWEPETTFEDGIVRTINWYLDNATWVEHVTSGEYRDYITQMYAQRKVLD